MSHSAEEWDRVQELFNAAVDLPAAQRAAFLVGACGGNDSLRREVESLLASDAQANSFIETPVASVPRDLERDPGDAPIDQQFGAYRVLREIGRGGLGTVYLAERADKAFQKEVAIKVVRRGLDTEDILRRFQAERQILAQLEHPNIARLIDAGSTPHGLPYFVLEYVDGQTISEYCRARQLPAVERLKLFRLVCGAVAYAHQHLVIHRDLKPSNILVTRTGVPKLLDFGIAKVLHTDDPLAAVTMTGVRVMTPEYASPEQVRGLAISTSSDIYSLGVLLYELITGQKPYRLTTRSADELSRAITEQEPERPSAAVHQDSQFPGPDSRSLKGDLDNIVLMALRKEPERRYATVERFSEDIRRYLEGLPVLAHRDTFRYRASKFVRRNKGAVAGALLLMLVIICGMVATLWQSQIAQTERVRAEKRFNDVRQLANSNLFEVYPEVENLEGSIKAREAILKNALKYLDSLAHETGDDLELKGELATAYEKVGDVQGAANLSLGNYRTGFETYGKARELREAIYRATPENLEAKERLANNYQALGRNSWNDDRTKDAEEFYGKSLKLRRELVAAEPASVEAKNDLAYLLILSGAIPELGYQVESALVYFNEALAIIQKERVQHPEHVGLRKSLTLLKKYLGRIKAAQKDYDGALRDLNQAVDLSRDLAQEFPEDFKLQRDVWLSERQICQMYNNREDGGPGAVAACRKTVDFPRAALQREPENAGLQADLAGAYWDMARALNLAKDYPRAVEQADEALKIVNGLIQRFPDSAERKRYRAKYRTSKAESLVELAQFDRALAELQAIQQALLEIIQLDPAMTSCRWDLSNAYRLSAQASHRKGEDSTAVEYVDRAIAVVEQLAKLDALAGSEKQVLAKLLAERAEYLR